MTSENSSTMRRVSSQGQGMLDQNGLLSAPVSPRAYRRTMSNVSIHSDAFNGTLRPPRKPVKVRILIAGPESSGKTCLIKRYCEKRFVQKYSPTVGIDYGATKLTVDQKEISVHIFDTSGSNLFRDVRSEFYRESHGIILVFDVGRRETFDALHLWVKEVFMELAKEGKDFDKTSVFVCANKCDISSDNKTSSSSSSSCRQVDEVEARLWAELRGFPLFETSAETGAGIKDMFTSFFSTILKNRESTGKSSSNNKSSASSSNSKRKSLFGGLSQSASSNSMKTSSSNSRLPNGNHSSFENEDPAKTKSDQKILTPPSPDQVTVMTRLKNGRDPWQKMGLVPGQCSPEEVNKTYRKLAVLLHPDKTAVDGADEAFITLGKARKLILLSLGKR